MTTVRDPAAHLPPEATRRAVREVARALLGTVAAFAGSYAVFLFATQHFGG